MYLLGCIDQKKEERKSASRDSGKMCRELRRLIYQLIEACCSSPAVPSRAAAPSQSVYNRKGSIAFEMLDDSSKSRAKISDVFVKRKVFRTDVVRSRGRSGGVSHRE
jgi:hypothetical protein